MGSSGTSTHQNFSVTPSHDGTGGGPWQETDPDTARRIEETRQGLEDDRLAEDTALDDTAAGGEDLTLAELVDDLSARRYRGDQTTVQMPNATGLRDALRRHPGEEADVEVQAFLDPHDLAPVAGTARVSRDSALGHRVDGTGLHCPRHPDEEGCEHTARAADAAAAVLDARRVRSSLRDWEANTSGVASDLASDHAQSVAARQLAPPAPTGPPWSEDTTAFQAAYDAARARSAGGEPAVPFYTENATGGLGARDGGRGFGVELEFDLPGTDYNTRAAALQAIGNDLHAAGLTRTPNQTGYHSSNDYSRWRFENDSTVDGEIVSPILYDEPASWQQLQQVVDIVRRHGGQATTRAGGHIHVGVADFDHTVENHRNLLGVFHEHEDVVYRLAQNPAARQHRGQRWCTPNHVPAAGYQSVGEVARNNPHSRGVNFGGVHGNSTDHVEFRMWDGSLDPGVIQAQVNLSLGMTHAALHAERGAVWGHEPIGVHRRRNSDVPRGTALRGDRWRDNTSGFRRLLDRVFTRDANREQATALFAATHWQQPRP
jgi:hypothetical protein